MQNSIFSGYLKPVQIINALPRYISLLVIMFVVCLLPTGRAMAKSYATLCTRDIDCPLYTPDCSTASSADSGVTTGNGSTPGPIYIMGDSITALAKATYEKKFTDPWKPTVEGVVSRHIAVNPPTSGLDQVKQDTAKLKTTNAIVIALGTNDYLDSPSAVKQNVKAIMDVVKPYDAPIYWVNIYVHGHDKAARDTNKAIADGVGDDGTVIDWYSTAKSKADVGSFNLGVHPTNQADINLLVNLVYATVANGPDSSAADHPTPNGAGLPDDELAGKDNREKIWNYLLSLGFSPIQAAGIEGNIGAEGVYDPQNIEDPAGRTKDPSGLTTSKQGWGLIGFTPGKSIFGAPWDVSGVNVTKNNVYYISTQLNVIYGYMKNSDAEDGKNMLKEYQDAATSPAKGADAFESLVEHAKVVADQKREKIANDAMRDFGNGSPSTVSNGGSCCPAGAGTDTTATPAPGGASAGPTQLIGKTPGQQVYNFFFITKGLSNNAAAAATGNLQLESINFKYVDGWGGGGGNYYGLAQWGGTRYTDLIKFAGNKTNAAKLNYQLDYVWHELTTESSYKPTLDSLKGNDSLVDKTLTWVRNYEGAVNSDGSLQMPGQRIVYAKQWAKNGGGDATATPASGAGSSDCATSGSSPSGGTVSADGHIWPVDIKKSEVDSGYPWPCPGNCHHDGTAAFDLSTKKAVGGDDADVVGRAEYAITDGSVDSMHVYMGIAGCYAMEFRSSTDGYVYWYGHMRRPAVKEGEKNIKVGQKVGEVGERKCTGNGSYPHLHIDRGSPKGSPGGYVDRRDAGLTPLINKLYADLPN